VGAYPGSAGFDPGGRYRKTRYGWEPVDAWKPPERLAVTSGETEEQAISRLFDEAAGCGCPPERAFKWWRYALEALGKREAEN